MISSLRTKVLFLGVFIAPSMLLLSLLMLYPLLNSIYLSLTEFNFVYSEKPVFIGLGNYIKLLSDPEFWNAAKNTLIFATFFFILLISFSLLVALLVTSDLRGMKLLRTVVFLPIIVALSLTGVIFQWILNFKFGIVNHVLDLLHLPYLIKNWLGDPDVALFSIILVSVWRYSGIVMILFIAGLQAIPGDLYEAAKIDGAGWWHRFIYVTIPNLKETFIVTGVWGIMNSIKVFEQPFVMAYGGPAGATTTLYFYSWRSSFEFYEMGYGSAIAYVVALLVLIASGLNIFVLNRDKNLT
ncbi:carbohydrate ABC transporter permease [Paenibacillus hamazuiensis]|uniref:carbohydrate ABC transporter permease n=1 Tax=Paenibacillus hamazuiensis TaxID=2936508 RepID=UPI00200EE5AF|nr:sugar ABC transporter permease [Paenibacillus hamazuiensis]